MTSNSHALVAREIVDGTVEGVDFGPRIYCIARSPRFVLGWVYGHSWSLNGTQRYAEPHLVAFPSRRFSGNVEYKSFGAYGGRLSTARIVAEAENLKKLLGNDVPVEEMAQAVAQQSTLLIEGGGYRLMPARSLGQDAWKEWSFLPDKGFRM